jgi:hypothetical protein
MSRSPRRPAALAAAIFAATLSLGAALSPMTVHAASDVTTALSACRAAWMAQPGNTDLQDVRLDRLSDGNKIKMTLRARDTSGSKVTTRCVVSAKGEVFSVGDIPAAQLAAK